VGRCWAEAMAVVGRLAQCGFWFLMVGAVFLVLDLYT
jgi:hypothetical protein